MEPAFKISRHQSFGCRKAHNVQVKDAQAEILWEGLTDFRSDSVQFIDVQTFEAFVENRGWDFDDLATRFENAEKQKLAEKISNINPLGLRPFGGPAPAHLLAQSSVMCGLEASRHSSFDAPSPCGDFGIGGSYPYSSSHGVSTPKACL